MRAPGDECGNLAAYHDLPAARRSPRAADVPAHRRGGRGTEQRRIGREHHAQLVVGHDPERIWSMNTPDDRWIYRTTASARLVGQPLE